MSAPVAVTPSMRKAVVQVANDRLAEEVGPDYRITATSDGAHLLMADDDGRVLLWVQAIDNSAMPFRGWVTAEGRACETLADVEEAMAL